MNAANWQRGPARPKDKPKPIPRPGVEREKKYGSEPIPIDEMADWLGWETQLAQPEPVKPVDKTGPPPQKRDGRGRFTKQ